MQKFTDISPVRQWLSLAALILTVGAGVGKTVVWAADQRYEPRGAAEQQAQTIADKVSREQLQYRQEVLLWKQGRPTWTEDDAAELRIIEKRLQRR